MFLEPGFRKLLYMNWRLEIGGARRQLMLTKVNLSVF